MIHWGGGRDRSPSFDTMSAKADLYVWKAAVKEEAATGENMADLIFYHGCDFPYKPRIMGTNEPLKTLKVPYMARNPMKWGFFNLKTAEKAVFI